MFVLSLNSGSSSLRLSLFNQKGEPLFCERIDIVGKAAGAHAKALDQLVKQMASQGLDLKQIKRVGHRIVHGGPSYTKPSLLKAADEAKLSKLIAWAPLHLPANLATLKAAKKLFPKAQHWGFFDTAFHSTLPEVAKLYALPYKLAQKKGYHRYGFHGLSHAFVAQEAAKILHIKKPNLITCHMGNGVSLTAIKKGVSVDTTMGFTPLEGPMMGTRSGTIDPGLVLQLVSDMGLAKAKDLLEKQSGFLGLSGVSSDLRVLRKKMSAKESKRCFDLFSYQVAKLIASLMVPLNQEVDAIIFTGGIGENFGFLRDKILSQIKNFAPKAKALWIHTDEELFMAQSLMKFKD